MLRNKKFLSLMTAAAIFSLVFLTGAYADYSGNPFSEADRIRDKGINQALTSVLTLANSEKEAPDSNFINDAGTAYIVKYKDGISLYEIHNHINNYSYRLLGKSKDRIFAVKLRDLSAFENDNRALTEYIEEDKKITLAAVPNDTRYADQYAIPAINLPDAWDITEGNVSVNVAVIDTGFYRAHEDFNAGTVKEGYDCFNHTVGVTSDPTGHGTAVTAIIAAATNNAKGIAGACWAISVIPYRAADNAGVIYSSLLIDAINRAADANVDVINMSLGAYTDVPAVRNAVNYALSKDCIIVSSAGNEGGDGDPEQGHYSYPASYDGVISVAATDSNNERCSFSQYNDKVAVAAPGNGILTVTNASPASYGYWSGTSFSSPYVAGAAALARSQEMNINSYYFEELLKDTSTDLGEVYKDDYYGWGLLNAEAVADAAKYPIVIGAEDGETYAGNVTITFNKGTATLNGSPFTNGTTITAADNYTLIVSDGLGNDTTMHFGISAADESDFVFNAETGTITGYNGSASVLMIPSLIGGVPVTGIGDGAFTSIAALTSATIPYSVTSIGYNPFSQCPLLTEINADNNNQNFSSENGVLFNKNKTTLVQCPSGKSGSYIIPNSVTSIGRYAFAYCDLLTRIKIPSSVSSIGDFAFSGCNILACITIPRSVTSIGESAFLDSNNLILFGYNGSYAETYANENGIPFKLRGDVNDSGGITSADALMALQAASGRRTLNDVQKAAADVNSDGNITAVDALKILQFASGRITSF